MAETTDANRTAPSDAADEPLAKLYHMSATAGVGTQEYVAINPFAVIAVVLGLASALLLMGWNYPTLFYVLLVIPLAGLIFALMAISQIRNSNGTQAGIWWAVGGVLLSLVFAGTVTAHHIQRRIEADRQQQAVATLAERFGQAVMAGDYAAARDLFTPEFQQVWSLEQFRGHLERVLVSETLGKLRAIRPGPRAAIEDFAGGQRAVGRLMFDFEKLDGQPLVIRYERAPDGDWKIVSTELFPASPAAPEAR